LVGCLKLFKLRLWLSKMKGLKGSMLWLQQKAMELESSGSGFKSCLKLKSSISVK
jgi:hypothetical protein